MNKYLIRYEVPGRGRLSTRIVNAESEASARVQFEDVAGLPSDTVIKDVWTRPEGGV